MQYDKRLYCNTDADQGGEPAAETATKKMISYKEQMYNYSASVSR